MSLSRGFAHRTKGFAVAGAVVGAVLVAGPAAAAPVGAPSPPTAVSALDGPGDGQASVSFTPAGGTPATAYTATSTPGGIQSVGCTSSPCTVTGLTDGTSYTFTVHASSISGDSAESVPSNSVTPAPVPVIGSFTPAATQNYGTTQQLSATSSAGGSVTFSSTTPSTCTISAAGLVTPVAQGTCTAHADQPAGTTHPAAATVSKNITIVAVQPGAPTNVIASPGNSSATVAFTPPTSTGGASISGYTATSSPGGVRSTNCAASPCAVVGLTNGTLYTFTVTATNSATPTALTSVPSAVSNTIRPGVTPQSITFNNPGTQTFGTAPQLTATASSGLPVSFTSATTPVCTVTSAGKLTFVTVGTCTINADQSGDATHQSAPTVTRSFTVQKATPTVTVSSSANPSAFGQLPTFTAALAPSAATGQIQWSVDGANAGPPVAVSGGTATFVPSTPLAVGAHTVTAFYGGDANDNAAQGQLSQTVNKASTATVLRVSGDTLTATVTPVAPGAGSPTGTVRFTVGGATVGASAVGDGGVATFTASNVGNQGAAAYYNGDASFLASSGHRAPVGPTVVTHVTSAHARHHGWYRSPVYVSFTCKANTAALTAPCPATVKLSSNGVGRTVTRTVQAKDGGSTTVTVGPINIDRTPPKLSVRVSGRSVTCHAHDSLSGGASCAVRRHTTTSGGVATVHWKAVAHDRAGNTAVRRGRFAE